MVSFFIDQTHLPLIKDIKIIRLHILREISVDNSAGG